MANSNDAELKKRVAKNVQNAVRTLAFVLPYMPVNVVDIEATPVSDLVTQIRVKTADTGTHYYTVKVSEIQ